MIQRGRRARYDKMTWQELEDELPNGERLSILVVGDSQDPLAPRIVRSVLPPGTRIEVHTHDSDYVEIILEGAERVGRTWYRKGDIRRVKAGCVYGPLVAGPEGVLKLIVFRDGNWQPRQVKPGADEGLSTRTATT